MTIVCIRGCFHSQPSILKWLLIEKRSQGGVNSSWGSCKWHQNKSLSFSLEFLAQRIINVISLPSIYVAFVDWYQHVVEVKLSVGFSHVSPPFSSATNGTLHHCLQMTDVFHAESVWPLLDAPNHSSFHLLMKSQQVGVSATALYHINDLNPLCSPCKHAAQESSSAWETISMNFRWGYLSWFLWGN